MTPEERFARFEEMKAHYKMLDDDGLRRGELPMGETTHGFWGTTNMNDAWLLFRRIGLERFTRFVDLGTGDGRIVAIASLFTHAVGIEGDEDLVRKGKDAWEHLGLRDAELKLQDFYDEPLGAYDIAFMFPDKAFDARLVGKLLEEFHGHLLLYNDIYLPVMLPKGRKIWIEQLPVTPFHINVPRENLERGEVSPRGERGVDGNILLGQPNHNLFK